LKVRASGHLFYPININPIIRGSLLIKLTNIE
jgi:hypothetical protein